MKIICKIFMCDTFVSSGKVFMVLHDSFLLILDHNCTKSQLILLWVQLMMSSMKGQLIFTRHLIYGAVRLCELPIKSQIGPLNSFPNLLEEWAGRTHKSYTQTSLWLQRTRHSKDWTDLTEIFRRKAGDGFSHRPKLLLLYCSVCPDSSDPQ